MGMRLGKGFTLIELIIAMAVICVIATIALALLMVNPRLAANEAAAIATVRTIISTEKIYAQSEGQGKFVPVEQLVELQYLDQTFLAPEKSGYKYTVSVEDLNFTIVATPKSDRTGRRSFFGDESGLIRWHSGGTGAGPDDPPLGASAAP